MSARTSYRSLLSATGPGFFALSFLARLPSAMAPLGVIMLVVASTGSFAAAGIATAALGIGAAIGGPVLGALTDRHGQRRLGTIAALADAATLVAVVWAVLAAAPLPVVAALAAVVGLFTPQVGPLVRVRWAALLSSRSPGATPAAPLGTAMSYEGAADEASYVAGPALVGLLALTGVSALPLLAAAGISAAAAVPFALHRTATLVPHGARPPGRSEPGAVQPGAVRHRDVGHRDVGHGDIQHGAIQHAGAVRRLIRRGVGPRMGSTAVLVAIMVCIGVVFGATQTGITSLASSAGHAGSAGLIYAVLGVGSALAALATAWLPARFRLERRLSVFAVVLLLGALPLLAVDSLAVAAVAMAVLGISVAPLLITAYGLAERSAPPGRGGTTMTLLASGTVAGVALGAGFAGQLVGPYGHAGALTVPLVAGVVAVLVAVLGAGRFRASSVPATAPSAPAVPASVPLPGTAGRELVRSGRP